MTDEPNDRCERWCAARLEEYCRLTGTAPHKVSSKNFRRWLERHRPVPPDLRAEALEAALRDRARKEIDAAVARRPGWVWVRARKPDGDEEVYLVDCEKAPPAVAAEARRQASDDWDGTLPPEELFKNDTNDKGE
jgi:hypothetical protein